MRPEPDDGFLEDTIRQAVGSSDARFDASRWKKTHPHEITLMESWKPNHAEAGTKRPWNINLHNHPIRIAVSVAIAAGLAIVVIISTNSGSSAVFAECLEHLRATRYEFDMEVATADAASTVSKGMVLEPGKLRVEQRGGAGTIISVINNDTKQFLLLFPRFKAAYRFDREEEKEMGLLGFALLPGRSIENLWNLKDGARQELGRRKIDGEPVEGWQVTEEEDEYTTTITIWAHAETARPVMVIVEVRPDAEEDSAFELTMRNFRAAPELDPGLFSTNIPEGYTLANRQTLAQLAAQPDTPTAASAVTSPEAEKILESLDLWASGNKQKAADILMTVDWTSDMRFGREHHFFTMTERQYISLVATDQQEVMGEIIQQLSQLRGLGKKLLEFGRKAREANDFGKAEGYHEAVLRLGRLLNRDPDAMLIVRLLGIVLQQVSLGELSSFYEASGQPEKLEAARVQLKNLEDQHNAIKKTVAE